MIRVGDALRWSVIGFICGVLIAELTGIVMGFVRGEDILRTGLAALPPACFIGALGGFCGYLLLGPSVITMFTTFGGAMLGALLGKLIGALLFLDVWVLDSIAAVKIEGIEAFLLYHIDLVGGPQVVAGAFLGILAIGFLDVFFGCEVSSTALGFAALLTPVIALISAFIGHSDWDAAIVILVGTVVILFYWGKLAAMPPRRPAPAAIPPA